MLVPVSTTLGFFFLSTIQVNALFVVENQLTRMIDHPLPAAVDSSCPPTGSLFHSTSDEEESQLPDAHSKFSF